MSESERTPGYRKRSQVPPIRSRPSSMAKLFVGHALLRWHAPPIPDNPAPTMMTSTCSTRYRVQKSGKGTNGSGNLLCLLCFFVAGFRCAWNMASDFLGTARVHCEFKHHGPRGGIPFRDHLFSRNLFWFDRRLPVLKGSR